MCVTVDPERRLMSLDEIGEVTDERRRQGVVREAARDRAGMRRVVRDDDRRPVEGDRQDAVEEVAVDQISLKRIFRRCSFRFFCWRQTGLIGRRREFETVCESFRLQQDARPTVTVVIAGRTCCAGRVSWRVPSRARLKRCHPAVDSQDAARYERRLVAHQEERCGSDFLLSCISAHRIFK
jgi:hypothetical protein